MTQPTFDSLVRLLTGWVFSGAPTIAVTIVPVGAVWDGRSARGVKHHSAYHRVFAAARWSLDELGLALFDHLIRPWLDGGVILLALDDSRTRKRGLKIFGVGMHHDPQLSTRKPAIMYWGHSRVLLGVIARLPFCPARVYCLPILFRLYVGKKPAVKKQLAYRTQPELAIAMLHRLCQSHEHRRFHAIADSAYGGSSVLNHLPGNCGLTNRLALNLYGRHDRSRAAETVARVHNAPTRPLKIVAVERTAPTAMLLHGLIVLWFARIGHRYDQTPLRPWYTTKRHPSFADLLATLRQLSLEQEVSSLRLTGRSSRKDIKTQLQTLPRAA